MDTIQTLKMNERCLKQVQVTATPDLMKRMIQIHFYFKSYLYDRK